MAGHEAVGRRAAAAAGGYIPALDGLRGVAITLVLLLHLPGVRAFGGFIGVDVFFVLSGYLITSLLLREFAHSGKVSLPRFYMRRFLRLMPALWALVLSTLAAFRVFDGETFRQALPEAPWALLYVGNWAGTFGRTLVWFLHTWSLAVEEQFYLLWPALLWWCMARGGARRVFWAALALALCSWLWRAALQGSGTHWLRLYHGLDTRLDAPMWGCALAAWMHARRVPFSARAGHWLHVLALAALAAFAAVLVLAFALDAGRGAEEALALFLRYGSVLVAWLAALMILDAVGNPRSLLRPLLCWPPLVWWGMVSYSLYLWNSIVSIAMQHYHPPLPAWAEPPAFLLLSALLAALSFYVIERPFLRLKKRFEAVPSR